MSYYQDSRHHVSPLPPPPPPHPLRPLSYFPGDEASLNISSGALGGFGGTQALNYEGHATNQAASISPEQPYTRGPRPPPRPPYPPSSTLQRTGGVSQHYQPHQSNSSPPLPLAYNPQQYVQSAQAPSQGPPVNATTPARSYGYGGPQTYNPARYRDTDIASAVNQIYGPAFGISPLSDHTVTSPQYTSTPTASSLHNQSFLDTGQVNYNEVPGASERNQSHYYSVSAPLPSRTFQSSSEAAAGGTYGHASPDGGRVWLGGTSMSSSEAERPFPGHKGSLSEQGLSHTSLLQPSPSPDFHDDRPPSIFENPVDYHFNRFQRESPNNATSFTPITSSFGTTNQEQYLEIDRRMSLSRHPQSRPLPGPPIDDRAEASLMDADTERGYTYDKSEEELVQEDLFMQVENAIMGNAAVQSQTRSAGGRPLSLRASRNDRGSPSPLVPHGKSIVPRASIRSRRQNSTRTNGYRGSASPTTLVYYDDYSDESDAEAAAGLAAMQMAEEQEAADHARWRSNSGGMDINGEVMPQEAASGSEDHSSDEDYGYMDIEGYGGGHEFRVSYGGNPADLAIAQQNDSGHQHRSVSSRDSGVRDLDLGLVRTSSNTSMTALSVHAGYGPVARVDESGTTGGLADLNFQRKRMSFDEGDETAYIDDQYPQGDTSRSVASAPAFYSTSPSPHRPLPPPPRDGQELYLPPEESWKDVYGQAGYVYPVAPDAYAQSMAGHANNMVVPRSISARTNSSTPQLVPPVRARTDAEERKRQTMIRTSVQPLDLSSETLSGQSNGSFGFELPTIPLVRRFQPSKLAQRDFDRCNEPWALSSLMSWIRVMAGGEAELREHAVLDALVALFTFKVPNMNIAEAEGLSTLAVKQMFEAGTLIREEEWLKVGDGTVSGVLFQLTGKGCYAPSLHETESPGRCYARHCQRTVKKLNVEDDARQTGDWATFYSLSKEQLENVDKKEIERQNVLHEIVETEEHYRYQLNVLRVVYRDALSTANPAIIAPKQLQSFLDDVFGKLDAVSLANEEYLLPQLKYRQKDQGPFIVGFSDIFRDWIRKAKTAYIDYAANFPNANFLIRQEDTRNMLFHSFLEGARNNKMSEKLGFDTYLKAPITRLQRYGLLLSTVHRSMVQDSEEKMTLQTAIEEIRTVTLDCDTRVAEMGRKTEMSDLAAKLVLRPEMKRVELNLTHWGRKLFHKGDLQRTGSSRFTWLETHVMLFDNFLVLAKTVFHRDVAGGPKYERYDVSKMPIPMELLILESTDEDPVTKSSVKGIGSVSAVAPKPVAGIVTGLSRTTSSIQSPIGPGTLNHTSTSASLVSTSTTSSSKTLVPITALEIPMVGRDERTLYPFRIKHLGKESYTLFATSASSRKEWCDKIVEAKTEHAASLFAQNAEPFRLRVMADSAFAYDTYTSGQKSIMIKGTPLSRAISDVEQKYADAGRPAPICRARVNCATTFTQPSGKQVVAIGTDYGVYTAETGDARNWTRAIPALRVTQVAVLEDFKLFLLISDKSLVAYQLDVVCPPIGPVLPSSDSTRKAPQKLSGARDVGFFATGRMKDRTLIFYKKREGLSSTFKILEPILQKATAHKSRLLHRSGTVDSFREYDDFYVPSDCTALNLFTTSLAVSTTRGFEVLNLDKKTPWAVPDLKAPHVATIAARLRDMEPLAMFKLDASHATADGASGSSVASRARDGGAGSGEFLCVYDECAVYVNKHGDISRSVVLEFVGKARHAALEEGYLVLFDEDFVEIRDALNGRLKQVVAGKDVRCLDTGRAETVAWTGGSDGKRTVKFALQHPENERTQLVVELVLNEGRKH